MTRTEPRTARVLLYSHDGFGLGHLRRNLNVAGRLVRELSGSSALVVAGLPGIPGLALPEGVDLVKLPSIRKVGTDTWQARSLRVEDDRLQTMRREILAATFDSFDPDLVLVDYLPAGVWGELVGPIQELREARPEARIVLGLRDVLDAPAVTRKGWATAGHDAALRRLYDRVLVYGDPAVFDSATAYGLEELLPGRVAYTGYLCSEEGAGDVSAERARLGVEPDTFLHVVTAGGGADAFPMMKLTVEALHARARAGRREHAAIVTGPLMPDQQVEELRRLATGLSTTIVRTRVRIHSLIAAADLVVTMAAYNTLTDALRLQRPILSIPREGPSAEQRTRSALFEASRLLTRVPPEAGPEEVATAMDAAVSRPRLVAPPPSLDGLDRTVQELNALLPPALRGDADEDDDLARGAGSHA